MKALNLGLTILFTSLLIVSVCSADCNSGDRYEDNLNGTVTDCRTGLIWLKNANCTDTSGGVANSTTYLTWHNALKWVAGLGSGICGLNDGSAAGDWRLPSKTEWMAMVANAKKQGLLDPILTNAAGTAVWTNGNAFDNVNNGAYWSHTTQPVYINNAWYISLVNGYTAPVNKDSTVSVWPVRGGAGASFGYLSVE